MVTPADPGVALHLADLRLGGDGAIGCPAVHPTAGEDVLAGHLAESARILRERPEPPDDDASGLPADVAAMRWFRLPATCL